MGKLRTSIDNVVKTAGTLEKAASILLESREKEINNFMHATDMCRGGAEVMYMYLMEKFKKEGKKIEDHQKATLKDVFELQDGEHGQGDGVQPRHRRQADRRARPDAKSRWGRQGERQEVA